jgi:MEDS: MEthanogen/methylotroph, DcmR Sensory domain
MSPWDKVLETPDPQGHLVQLYQADERALTRNVSHYLWEGYKRGDGLLVIAGAEHRDAFRRQLEVLGADTDAAIRDGSLAFFDAQETLARFMINGQPDWDRFESVVRSAMGQVRQKDIHAGLRAYGEMVGILWKARQFSAAIRLEQFWNKLLTRSSFSLFCAYAIDVFGKEFQVGALDALLCNHTHLVPAETQGNLETAINQAMEDILGPKAHGLRLLIKANYRPAWAVLPAGEAVVLWLRNNLPDRAEPILDRARQHYQAFHPAAALVEGQI